MNKPVIRSDVRLWLGKKYYAMLRYIAWYRWRRLFCSERSTEALPYTAASHRTILLRRLKDVDMHLQYNKITNLKIAAACLDGIVLRPGEVFSYWRLIGRPSRGKGYVDGMILRNGQVTSGTGGGLCQMSNLIFWMTIHTPLTVIERHRHGYDVFPDAGRTQPFGSGATCFYPHGDLMIRNDTNETYRLSVHVGKEYLEGEWQCTRENTDIYRVEERNHRFCGEVWGGYSRHNEIWQLRYRGTWSCLKSDAS